MSSDIQNYINKILNHYYFSWQKGKILYFDNKIYFWAQRINHRKKSLWVMPDTEKLMCKVLDIEIVSEERGADIKELIEKSADNQKVGEYLEEAFCSLDSELTNEDHVLNF